ncbi:hypothetical protein RJ639_041573 [Escallonia herrerae]|uniref:Alcohol dehydrogenase-like N-terminal domain-containing protein n=1 Tax=Escallonia herrerae TaxID=1293975 RepID=A0AA88WE75_9ASTE|nr:hypothetical protein RJ639_041573 [Escallonia herrerae]
MMVVFGSFGTCCRETGEEDVRFKVWHEVVGVVTEVGSKVKKVKVGDNVGVGCMVGSCHSCDSCAEDLENYCPRMLLVYGSIYYDQTMTYGGYSDSLVCAEHFIVQTAAKGTMDGIIDTVSADHPMSPLIDLLKCHATLVLVGAPNKPLEIELVPLLMAKHDIKADVEVIPMDYVNTAMERLGKGDVNYRFVIDVGSTSKTA